MEKIYPCTLLFIQLQILFEFDEFSSPCLSSVSGSHIPLDGFSTPSPPVCDVSSLSPSFVEGRVTFEDPLVRSLLRASIRVCLTFPHGWSEVMDFWQKYSWPPPTQVVPSRGPPARWDPARETRPHSGQKQRKALFFGGRLGR